HPAIRRILPLPLWTGPRAAVGHHPECRPEPGSRWELHSCLEIAIPLRTLAVRVQVAGSVIGLLLSWVVVVVAALLLIPQLHPSAAHYHVILAPVTRLVPVIVAVDLPDAAVQRSAVE